MSHVRKDAHKRRRLREHGKLSGTHPKQLHEHDVFTLKKVPLLHTLLLLNVTLEMLLCNRAPYSQSSARRLSRNGYSYTRRHDPSIIPGSSMKEYDSPFL